MVVSCYHSTVWTVIVRFVATASLVIMWDINSKMCPRWLKLNFANWRSLLATNTRFYVYTNYFLIQKADKNNSWNTERTFSEMLWTERRK
uniref:Uncharacterized protein n=1 Tax=Magallana gigas TaxID=29159 RepID=K1Q2E1_MAGGI